jgi:hypothetical protein
MINYLKQVLEFTSKHNEQYGVISHSDRIVYLEVGEDLHLLHCKCKQETISLYNQLRTYAK